MEILQTENVLAITAILMGATIADAHQLCTTKCCYSQLREQFLKFCKDKNIEKYEQLEIECADNDKNSIAVKTLGRYKEYFLDAKNQQALFDRIAHPEGDKKYNLANIKDLADFYQREHENSLKRMRFYRMMAKVTANMKNG